MQRMTATVHGRVQGVGFRAFTQEEATRLGLVGWVANQWDGSVLVVAEGPDAALQRLVDWLHRGSPAAHVERVDVTWHAAEGGLRGFAVRR